MSQITALTTEQAATLSTAQINAITTDQIHGLETSDIAAMSMAQLSALSGSVFAEMSGAQLDAWFAQTPIVLDLDGHGVNTLAAAQGVADKMAGLTVSVARKAGMDGRLFGSVTNADVADALTKAGTAIAKSQVRLPNGPLKTVGEFPVSVVAHTDVVVEVTVQVVAEAE